MLTARFVSGRVASLVSSLQTSPPAGIVTAGRPAKVRSRVMVTAAPSAPGPAVACPMVSGPVPKVFWSRTRTASPPWLRWVIIRSDWPVTGASARPSCDWAHEVNHAGRAPAAPGADTTTAAATETATSRAIRRTAPPSSTKDTRGDTVVTAPDRS